MITIAIDGFSACGKSTLAKALAKNLQYTYVDTGAMYRAVTLYFIRHAIDFEHQEQIVNALHHVIIRFTAGETYLNNENVETEIRKQFIADKVSYVAAIPAVRHFLVHQQQIMGKNGGVVMDGRDIGTAVFPNAELKLFLTADPLIRAERRLLEHLAKGETVSLEEIKKNLAMRDHIDSTRSENPLRQADDAILLDNSYLSEAEQLKKVLGLVENIKKANG